MGAGSTLPQQLQMYQSHNHQSFGYMDLPRLNMSGFGPTAPMTSTGINNGNANGIGNELLRQQLIGKLAQINYMQQLNAMTNMNPFATINPMQFQQPHTHNIDSSQIYLQNQSNLIQQQMNDLNQRSNQQTFNNPMQSRMRSTTEPLQQNKLQQNNVKQINEEYDKLLAKVEANKKNKKKKKKQRKKQKKQSEDSSDSSEDSEEESDDDSDDSDDDDSDSDDSDSDDSDSSTNQKKKKKKSPIVEDDADDDMKYPPIPFGQGFDAKNDINLDNMKSPNIDKQREEDLDTIFNEHNEFEIDSDDDQSNEDDSDDDDDSDDTSSDDSDSNSNSSEDDEESESAE